jgi:Domain of unknown function (DUF4214)/Bacterial Ig domain
MNFLATWCSRRDRRMPLMRYRPKLDVLESRLLPSAASQRVINQAYLDLLHRPADPGGLVAWSSLIDAGHSTAQVIALIETSPEYRADEVAQAFQLFLNRPADPVGLQASNSFLSAGGSVEQLDAAIIASPEYLAVRGGDSPTGFLVALYHDVFGRAVDPHGASFWGGILSLPINPAVEQEARLAVAADVLNSPEAHGDEVTRYYKQFLHRAPDANGFAGWVAALNSGERDEAIIAGFVGSDEYARRLAPPQAQPPTVKITSPAAGLTTAQNITIAGRVMANGSAVVSLQAQVDTGAPTAVSFDASGNFQFTTTASRSAMPLSRCAHTTALTPMSTTRPQRAQVSGSRPPPTLTRLSYLNGQRCSRSS